MSLKFSTSERRRSRSSFHGVNLDAWFHSAMHQLDDEQVDHDRLSLLGKAQNRRSWRPLLALALLLVVMLVAFVLCTWPCPPQPQARATKIEIFFPQHSMVSFNVTTFAPPAASWIHQIDLLSAECTISVIENLQVSVEDFAKLSIQGPIRLLETRPEQDTAVQALHGSVHSIDIEALKILVGQGNDFSFGITCKTVTGMKLYWSLLKFQHYDEISDTLFHSFAESINSTLQNFTVQDGIDLQDGISLEQESQTLFLRLELPVLQDTTGAIASLLVHLPEVAFDVSMRVMGDLSMLNRSTAMASSRAIFTVGSSYGSWLAATSLNVSASELGDTRHTETGLFITCAQDACTKSILPVVELAMEALTAHPVRGVVVSATASSPSSRFFTDVLGNEHTFIFTQESHSVPRWDRRSRRQSASVSQNASSCMISDIFANWQLRICAGGDLSSSNPRGSPNLLPSVSLALAEKSYFVSGQGTPLLSILVNVTTFRKLTVQDARNLLGFDPDHDQPDGLVEESTRMVVLLIQINASGSELMQDLFELDYGTLQDSGFDKLSPVNTSFAALRVMDTNRTVLWELIGSVSSRIQQNPSIIMLGGRFQNRLGDVNVFDWSSMIKGEVTSSQRSINYYVNGHDISVSSQLDLISVNCSTRLQLGSGGSSKELELGGYVLWRSNSSDLHDCSFQTCTYTGLTEFCNDPIHTSSVNLSLSLDGQWDRSGFQVDSNVSWNARNEQWNGSSLLRVRANQKQVLDLDGALRYRCASLITPDATSSADPFPYTQRVLCALTGDYVTNLRLGTDDGEKGLGAGWQLDVNTTAVNAGQCWSPCLGELVTRSQVLNRSGVHCYDDSPNSSDVSMHMSINGWSNQDNVTMDMMVAGGLNERHLLNWSSTVLLNHNGDGLLEWDNFMTGIYIDSSNNEPAMLQQAAGSFVTTDLSNMSLMGDLVSILVVGKARNKFRGDGRLRLTSFKDEVLNCSWHNVSSPATCHSVSYKSGMDSESSVDLQWNDENILVEAALTTSALDKLRNGSSLMTVTRNKERLLNWSSTLQGTHVTKQDLSNRNQAGVTSITSDLLASKYSMTLELARADQLTSLDASGEFDVTILSYWYNYRQQSFSSLVNLSMDGLSNHRDKIRMNMMVMGWANNNLLNGSSAITASSNGDAVLDWTSSLVGGYESALETLIAKTANSMVVNGQMWSDLMLEGSVGLQADPHASLSISRDGNLVFFVNEVLQLQLIASTSQLVFTALTTLRIPGADVDHSWSFIFQVTSSQSGVYGASMKVVEDAPPLASLARRSASSSIIFEVQSSVLVHGPTANTVQDFLAHFALAATSLEVALSVMTHDRNRLTFNSTLGSTGDMRGGANKTSCVELDFSFMGPATLLAHGDMRMNSLRLPWEHQNSSSSGGIATLEHVTMSWRENDATNSIAKTNDVLLGQIPSCLVSSTLSVWMSVDAHCMSGLCKDQRGFCTACRLQTTTVVLPAILTTPPLSLPPPPPPPPPVKINRTLTREAITSVSTIIATSTAISASSVAVGAVASSVLPSLSSTGASGATGRSSSFATSLILQTQFIAITGQLGGNSSTEAVSDLSSQLGWSNYKFFSIFHVSSNSTCDRAKQSKNELLSTLVACAAALSAASLLRLVSNQIARCRKGEASPDHRRILFPKWELAVSITQVQGLSLATAAAMSSGCLPYIIFGALVFACLVVEVLTMLRLVWLAKRGSIVWEQRRVQDTWVELKQQLSELVKEKKISSGIAVTGTLASSLVRGNWSVDSTLEGQDKSWRFMTRFGMLVGEVCRHAWWYGVYSIGVKPVHALMVYMLPDGKARSSGMTAMLLLDLVLNIIFTPQLDWRAWGTQLLAALGNVGICLTFLLRAMGLISSADVTSMYFAFVVVSIMPMILASLAKDGYKAATTAYQFFQTLQSSKTNDSSPDEGKPQKDGSKEKVKGETIETATQDVEIGKERKYSVEHGIEDGVVYAQDMVAKNFNCIKN
ncbi:hypothetical protein GUITHDRAFT_102157 [Guillardia theta CCMP2712]|uniref:Uncharacterized protein n=1 Tax=Guillardia theta (strain CCMP2712) TaxID=905079 RepID=L1JVM9_GUITC|nr:hypothetical protein GUITHDRAFT_102157 [Guillardia theta CCMP2712]EKX52255.1 hypothetical protein GUITHDRAFT_102157 [Guillardia theta CCMP2712]|eukprot:XP_005839235.1 hypothetical protein GUITHDRAFT_102157 [Guillardia theta CCMP2712]